MVWQLPVSFYKYIRREKIMKKIVALLMTAVMTIGMATAAFAAPSPQPTTGTIVGGKNASGQDVDLSKVKTSDNYSTNDAPGVEKIKANPQSVLKDAVGAANANGYGLAYVTNITADSDVQFPLTLTFKVNGVNSTSKVIVLRYVNGQWVQINGVVGDGNVTVTVDGASPIAFYVLNTNAAGGNNGANGANGTDGSKVVSPKTGSAPVMMCVVAVAVAAAAGMCVTSRRKHVKRHFKELIERHFKGLRKYEKEITDRDHRCSVCMHRIRTGVTSAI